MGTQNTINHATFHIAEGITLPKATYLSAITQNAPSGTTDLYTCPVGRRAYINALGFFNGGASGCNLTSKIKVSGNYYQIYFTQTVAAAVGGTSLIDIVLEGGESFSATTTLLGMNFWLSVVEFDTNCGFFTSKILSFTNGFNTLYTVSSGKTAFICGSASGGLFNSGSNIFYINQTSGSIPIYVCVVPNGSSPGANNQFTVSQTVSNTGITNVTGISALSTMNSGDFISINSASSNVIQWAYVNVFEV
jgi:hypothetical protein